MESPNFIIISSMTCKFLAFATIATIGVQAATPISKDCLHKTSSFGQDHDDDPSMQPYTDSNFDGSKVLSSMRITEIKVCSGRDKGNLKGFQFKLSDPENPDVAVDLPYMGKPVDEELCQTVSVPEPIDEIYAITNNKDHVRGIVFRAGDWEADFSGDHHNINDEKTW